MLLPCYIEMSYKSKNLEWKTEKSIYFDTILATCRRIPIYMGAGR
ncbi:hypothetical protein bcere0022_19040 [Bacillus cereus Rock3-44]|nr:hypothetical protein bcere0022_19040 [Bacillus cereus Rock3-44]